MKKDTLVENHEKLVEGEHVVKFLRVAFIERVRKFLLQFCDILERLEFYFFKDLVHFEGLERSVFLQPLQLQLYFPPYCVELVILEFLEQIFVFGIHDFFHDLHLIVLSKKLLLFCLCFYFHLHCRCWLRFTPWPMIDCSCFSTM
jgi:hypothetical protein